MNENSDVGGQPEEGRKYRPPDRGSSPFEISTAFDKETRKDSLTEAYPAAGISLRLRLGFIIRLHFAQNGRKKYFISADGTAYRGDDQILAELHTLFLALNI